MEDKMTPMEAEVLELSKPVRCSEQEAASYGTATPPKPKRSYVGLWVTFGLAVIALCTVGVVAAMTHVRLEKNSGGWSLQMNRPQTSEGSQTVQELSLTENSSLSAGVDRSAPEAAISLHLEPTQAAELAPAALYQSILQSFVTVRVSSYYSDSYLCCGVILSEDGYLLTAGPGLSEAAGLEAMLPDGSSQPAEVVGEDSVSGLTLLKIEAANLTPASFSEENQLQVGQTVYGVGTTSGSYLRNALAEGILSAYDTVELEGEQYSILLTALHPTLSSYGCPLLDSFGRVIGLSTPVGTWLGQTDSEVCCGVSTASLQQFVSDMAEEITACPDWLGFRVGTIPARLSGLYRESGRIWITELEEASSLRQVLAPYDVVVSVDGTAVSSVREFYQLLSRYSPGDTFQLVTNRRGVLFRISIRLSEE